MLRSWPHPHVAYPNFRKGWDFMSRTDGMQGLVERLLAERNARAEATTTLRTDTAAFRGDIQSAHAAMTKAQNEKLAAARSELAETRRQMAAQTAEFRRNVQAAHQASAKALQEKLMAERANLSAETSQLMQEAASHLAEIQADAAGVAAAWRMMTTGQTEPDAGQPRKPAKGKRSPKSE